MRRIAYLTGASWRGAALREGALPAPDEDDFRLLSAAGREAGLSFAIQRWSDPRWDPAAFDLALVRSCWDYVDRSERFVSALEAIAARGGVVLNPPAAIRWNMRKTYLEDLARAEVRTVPTMFVERATAHDVLGAFDLFDAAELVAKPQIGAGASETLRIRRNAWSEADLALGPAGPAMLQPFLPSIESEGERSLLYFGGRFAYAIAKRPAEGNWFANVDGALFARTAPSAADREAAERVIAAAPQELLYARVDLVTGADGLPALIELEAIEPHLFLDLAPDGAAAFVRALAAVLEGRRVLSG
jgi:glutathione synthase/RimK-type ligase-like ATP-grasp enzyme